MNTTSTKTKKIVMAALMAAMTCIATMVLMIPSPMNGYVNLGDGLVLLSGIILGPIYGGAAAGIGSMMADLLSGYAHYAPGTLIIKALAAVVGGFIYHWSITKLSSNKKLNSSIVSHSLPIILAGIGGGIIVTGGYFFYSSLFLGKGLAAIASIPGNIIQNILGILISSALMPFLMKTPFVKELMVKEA